MSSILIESDAFLDCSFQFQGGAVDHRSFRNIAIVGYTKSSVMPPDTLPAGNDTSHYQLHSVDTISSNRSVIITNYIQKDQPNKLFNIPIEVVFTSIVVPLVAFLLGLLVTRVRQKWTLVNNAKSHEAYFITWVNLIIDRVNKQSQAVKKFSEEMLDMDNKLHYSSYNFHIDKIKEISAVELYKALVIYKKGNLKEKQNNYYTALNSLDFLQRKYSECIEFVKRFHEQEKHIEKDWLTALQDLNNKRLKFITAKQNDLTTDPFLHELYTIHEEMTKIKETRTTLFENYITKINAICNKYLNLTPADSRVLEITQINNRALAAYFMMKKARENNSEAFLERHKQLENSMADLSRSTSALKQVKFKAPL